MTRRRLAPTSLLALLTLGLVALAPGAGIRVHRHADHGPAHVHLEDLLGGGTSGEAEPATLPAGRSREDATERHSAAPWSHATFRTTSLDLVGSVHPSVSPPGRPTLRRHPDEAHAHVASPFLRILPAALLCWIVSVLVLDAAHDPAVSCPRTRPGRARARSPPLASRSLRAI
jgi:hypothetical protein